jgi:hypothetical protein
VPTHAFTPKSGHLYDDYQRPIKERGNDCGLFLTPMILALVLKSIRQCF